MRFVDFLFVSRFINCFIERFSFSGRLWLTAARDALVETVDGLRAAAELRPTNEQFIQFHSKTEKVKSIKSSNQVKTCAQKHMCIEFKCSK